MLFGLYLAEGFWQRALFYVIPIIAFVLGIFIAELVKHKMKQQEKMHWRQVIIGVEILVLTAVAFIPQGSMDVLANVAISFVCAMQVEAFRKVHGQSYATTMCTGNLRSATEQLFYYIKTKDKQARKNFGQYMMIIGFFIFGAIVGALVTIPIGKISVLFCCMILVFVFILMFVRTRKEGSYFL